MDEVSARAPVLDRLVARLRGADLVAPVAVAGLLLVGAAVHLALARHVLAPWIEPDELQYAQTGRSFASTGHYLFRDHPYALRTIYPALTSPAWFAGSIHTAYTLVKAINVMLMVAGAIPLYLWGRRLVAPVWAALAVVLYLAMPGFMYTAEIVTENAFVPAMVLACFALAVAMERPTLLTQALALVAIALAVAIRLQGVILLLVLPTAIGLVLLLDALAAVPGERRQLVLARLRRFWPSLAAVGLGVLAYAVYELGRGASLSSGFGVYQRVTNAHYSLRPALRWIVYHFGELGLSVGLIPLSALILLFGLACIRATAPSAAERAFLAVSTAAVFWMVVQVGTFASQFSLRVEDRNMFNVAPLLFLALAVWLARGLPRPPALTGAAVAVPLGFLVALPYQSLISTQAFFTDTFGLIPIYRLQLLHTGPTDLTIVVGLAALGAGLLFASVPRSWARLAIPIAIAGFLVYSSRSVYHQVTFIGDSTRHAGGLVGDPSWIDHAIGKNSRAEFLYTTDIDRNQHMLWQAEFWNRSVRRVFGVTSQDPSIPDVTAPLDYGNGKITPALAGPDASPRYVVAAANLDVNGTRVAHAGFLALTRVKAPLGLASSTLGISPDGWTADWGDYLRYAAPVRGAHVTVTLSRPGAKGAAPAKVTVKVGRLLSSNGAAHLASLWTQRQVTLRADASHSFLLPLRPEPFIVQLSISRTFSATVLNPADTRRLGVVPTFQIR
jgi:hypothetical protein